MTNKLYKVLQTTIKTLLTVLGLGNSGFANRPFEKLIENLRELSKVLDEEAKKEIK